MILTLQKAQAIDPGIEQSDLDAFETSIRELTHNNFQIFDIRLKSLSILGKTITSSLGSTKGMRVGDTVEINDTIYNDGLYVIDTLTDTSITVVSETDLFEEDADEGILTLVRYPADVIKGVTKLIEYDKKMADKIGVKSESISRMSVTYYDVNASENAEGYPKALLDFIHKYEKMRWF